jgi:hypothetical protein
MKITNGAKEHDHDKTHAKKGIVTFIRSDATAEEITDFLKIVNEEQKEKPRGSKKAKMHET